MSLNKAIKHKKERRRPYRGAKAVDSTCRNHGSCDWCKGNRIHRNEKKALGQELELKEYFKNGKEK